MSFVPSGWTRVRIGDICSLKNGRAFKPSEWSKAGLPIVRIQNLNNRSAPFNYYDGEFEERYHLKGGELLFAWSGTPGTSFGAHIWRGGEAVLNQHIFRVDFDESAIDKRFLRRAINQKLAELIDIAHGGVGLRHVTKGKFEATEILLAPLEEQRRISDKLDRLLAAVDTCKARLDAIPDILKRFRQSVLAAAVSGKLTEEWRSARGSNGHYFDRLDSTLAALPQKLRDRIAVNDDSLIAGRAAYGDVEKLGWRYYSLQQLVDQARGIPYGIVQTGGARERGVPTVRAGDIKDFSIDVTQLKLVSPDLSEKYRRTVLSGGEILLAIRGSVGSAAIARPELAGGNISREVAMIPLIEDVDSAYIVYVISSSSGQALIGAQVRGVAQAGINLADLRELVVPLPPLDEQQEIVLRVERLLQLVQELQAHVDAARIRVDKLGQGLLAKAFRGELLKSSQGIAVSPKGKVSNQTRHFARAVLSAEIVHRLHTEPTFGRIKHQKIFHLCEHIAQLRELEGRYHREAAGPLDNRLIYANESELKKQNWYEEFPRPKGGHAYRPLSKAGHHRKYAERYWPQKLQYIAQLIELMRTWSTEQCEIFSTCYAAWNDLIIKGMPVTDDLIIREILGNWHPAKERIPELRWKAALDWIRKAGFVPTGFGSPTITHVERGAKRRSRIRD